MAANAYVDGGICSDNITDSQGVVDRHARDQANEYGSFLLTYYWRERLQNTSRIGWEKPCRQRVSVQQLPDFRIIYY
jgi:hypothetical protein